MAKRPTKRGYSPAPVDAKKEAEPHPDTTEQRQPPSGQRQPLSGGPADVQYDLGPKQEPHPAPSADPWESQAVPFMEPPEDEDPRVSAEVQRIIDRWGEGRDRRKPLGAVEPRLTARVPRGMVGRWVNDSPGRVIRAAEGGYTFISDNAEIVQDRDGARIEHVGTAREGGAQRAYLMAIPKVLYDLDQAAKQRRVDEVDYAIKRGIPQQAEAEDRPAFYTPSEGINMRNETR